MERSELLQVVFFETKNKKQPVRDFILSLKQNDRKTIGGDIFVVQKTFPLGLPLVRKMGNNLWEIRSTISQGIVRIFFTIESNFLILLHGFVKKTQKTPKNEIELCNKRMADQIERGVKYE